MLSVLDVLELGNGKQPSADYPSGVKNPVYYAMEKVNGKIIFGESDAKVNEFQTIEEFKKEKLVSFPFYDECVVYISKDEWLQDR
jgi:hypothetical protein